MSSKAPLIERFNPVFIKELRQAIRGRSFRASFNLTLGIAAIVSTGFLVNLNEENRSGYVDSNSGSQFFFSLYLVFLFCSTLVVPVQSHRSMSSERDERTLDALLISGLSPSQIILGKWLGSATTLLIFLVAMLPFFATAATLYGLDLLSALMITLLACSASMTLSLIGILTSCLGTSKATSSMFFMIFLGACGISMASLSGIAGGGMLASSGFGSTSDFVMAISLIVAGSGFAIFWLHGVAVATISHPEENGMLRVRWASLSIAAFFGIAPVILITTVPSFTIRDLFPLISFGVAFLAFFNTPTLTESTVMRARCRYEIESGLWRRPGAWLFLPGGGSGYMLFLLQLFIAIAPVFLYLIGSRPSGTPFGTYLQSLFNDGLVGYIATISAVLGCLSLPAFVAAQPGIKPQLRNKMRFFLLTSPGWIFFFLGFVELITGMSGNLFTSFLNPLWVIIENHEGGSPPAAIIFWTIIAALTGILMLSHAAKQRRDLHKIRMGVENN